MEVHHHAHTERKKWIHYFWEFLMLFFAVFCGFLAEYTLEHKIEKDREKQFIKSLTNDIKVDIAHLNELIARRNEKLQRLDSLIYLFNLPDYSKYGSSIYFNAIHTGRTVDIVFTSNNGTLQQLKNAGGLRLIRNRTVVDSISAYDVKVRNLEVLGEQEIVISREYRQAAKSIFNSMIFDKMLDENNISFRPDGNPTLLDFSKSDLDQLNFFLYSTKVVIKGNRRDARKLLMHANNLLATISREYQLE